MKKAFLITALFFGYLNTCLSQTPGDPDPSFGNKGIVTSDFGARIIFPGLTKSILVRPDSSIYVIFEDDHVTHVTKILRNGSKDITYGNKSFSVAIPVKDAHAALQSDGKIVVAGYINNATYNFCKFTDECNDFGIARINTNGSLDSTFAHDGIQTTDFEGSYDAVTSLAIQKDDKIVVSGIASTISDPYYPSRNISVARYNIDGSLDNTFGDGGKIVTNYGDNISWITIQNDGTISIVAAAARIYIRYNSNGILDNAITLNPFNNAGLNFVARVSTMQSDGKILVGGFWEDNYTNDNFVVARYRTNGNLDSTFGINGIQTTDFAGHNEYINSLVLQSDGKIIAVGYASNGSNYDFALARYNSNGSPDNTFDGDGKRTTKISPYDNYAVAIAIQQNGKLVVAGYNQNTTTNIAVAKYNSNGSLDNTFSGDGFLIDPFKQDQGSTVFTSTALQSDGKAIVAGYTWNGANHDFVVARYLTNGSLDNSFSLDGIQISDFASDEFAQCVAIQNDGKIILAGTTLVRYNSDGSLDNTFDSDGRQVVNFPITKVVVQKDGKILVGGGQSLARYNGNGSPDVAFNTTAQKITTTERTVKDIALQSDSKIVVVLADYAGSEVVRFNVDGSFEGRFQAPDFFPGWVQDYDYSSLHVGVESVKIQSDGKILVGGFAGIAGRYDDNVNITISRYNTNRSLDTTFSKDGKEIINFDHYSKDCFIAVQDDGKIVLGGLLYEDNSDEFPNITFFGSAFARLNSNGELDDDFGAAGKIKYSETNDQIHDIAIGNNKLYTVGYRSSTGKLGLLLRFLLEANKAPLVSITTPTNNSVYTAPATITIKASASDVDGTISYVKFYNAGTFLKTDSTSPFSYTITNLQAGNYSFVAKPTDNNGLSGSSASVAVTVAVANKAPVVNITSPVNNAIYTAPATITINATASDVDGTIKYVKFYKAGTFLKTDSIAPFSYTVTNLASGNYSFVAKATDNKGLSASSASVAVAVSVTTNKAPVVSITSPTNNGVFASPGTFTVNANASDPDGTISKVEFFSGATLLKIDSTNPYTYTASNLSPGIYNYVAKATDNKSKFSSSASVTVSVLLTNKAPVVNITSPTNDTFYYAPGSFTVNAAASDVDGTISKVQFILGATVLKTDSTSPYTYTANNIAAGNYNYIAKATDNKGLFSSSSGVHVVVLPNKPPDIHIAIDDGIYYEGASLTIYADASDIDGVIKYVQYYDGTTLLETQGVNSRSYSNWFKWDNIPAGSHSLTIKATDNHGLITNSAVININVIPNKHPIVKITSPANNAIFNATTDINIDASASDPDGTIQYVDFYNGKNFIIRVDNSPYSTTRYDVPAGNYLLTARATDNHGATTTSELVHIIVTDPNTLEAEEAVLSGAIVASAQAGFTGFGYADCINASGDYIEWTVNTPNAELFSLYFRYANGGSTNRPLELRVNGVIVNASLSFSTTGSWTNWVFSSAPVNLIEGTNKIRLTTIGSNGPNVDHLVVTANTTLEAEEAYLWGPVVASTQPGFTGFGYADCINSSGDLIQWEFDAENGGLFNLNFRYANGGTTNRPLQLRVNGAVVNASLSFSPTGSWSNWTFSSTTAILNAGYNQIRLITIGSNGPNVDHLAFSSNNFIQSVQRIKPEKVPLNTGDFFKAYVAPNPVSHGAKLIVSTSSNLPISFVLFDMLGRSHKSLKLEPGGSNTFDFSVSDLLPGSYIIILKQGNANTHARLIVAGK